MANRSVKLFVCTRCGDVYQSRVDQPVDKLSVKQICPRCREETERQLVQIQRALSGLESVSVAELSQLTGIDEATVRRLVEEHQLSLSAGKIFRSCSVCGAEVTGDLKYCVRCTQNLSSSLAQETALLSKRMVSSDRIYRPGDKTQSDSKSAGIKRDFEEKKKFISPPDPGSKIK